MTLLFLAPPSLSRSSFFLYFLLLLCSSSSAIRHGGFHHDASISPSLYKTSALRLPHFREAPAFRNGAECSSRTVARRSSISESDNDDVCDDASVHVAMTLDLEYIRGSVAAILSIVKHTVCPENVIFHFLATELEAELSEILRSTFPYLRFKVYKFDEELVRGKISASVRKALEQPLNYARAYASDILPSCVRRIIYLDSDVVVVDDIRKLWATELEGRAVGAPEYCNANFTNYFTEEFWADEAMAAVFKEGGGRRKACYFNTGVMVMDMEGWRREGYSREIERWMEVQRGGGGGAAGGGGGDGGATAGGRRRIYELGSLPPFLLVFAGRVKAVEERWNQHGLGGDNESGNCRELHPGPVSLLHWSGKGKPWFRLHSSNPCPLDSLWAPYDLLNPIP